MNWYEDDYYKCYNAKDDNMDNDIRSINTHNMRVVVFDGEDCSGKNFITGPGEGVCETDLSTCKSLESVNQDFNDIISSYMLVPSM